MTLRSYVFLLRLNFLSTIFAFCRNISFEFFCSLCKIFHTFTCIIISFNPLIVWQYWKHAFFNNFQLDWHNKLQTASLIWVGVLDFTYLGVLTSGLWGWASPNKPLASCEKLEVVWNNLVIWCVQCLHLLLTTLCNDVTFTLDIDFKWKKLIIRYYSELP